MKEESKVGKGWRVISTCCYSDVTVMGGITKYHVCNKCFNACDVKETPFISLDKMRKNEEKIYSHTSIKGIITPAKNDNF